MATATLTRRTLLAAMAATPFARAARARIRHGRTAPCASSCLIRRPAAPTPPRAFSMPGSARTSARLSPSRISGGAGGTIGEEVVAKAAPDGDTILHDATAFSVNGSLYPNLPFDYRKDFEPVVLVGEVANILVATPSLPVNTAADVIAFAKAAPDGINMASSGNGTLQHLLLELFRERAGIKINHVPYRGGGLALTDVMAGQVQFFFANGSSAVGLIKGGKVKAIAHTGKSKLASLPDLPAMSDTLPGFEGYDWNGVFVPHGTPAAIVQKLNAAANKALTSPQVTTRFAELNVETHPTTPQEFRAYIESQMELWSRVVKDANIKLG